jgi:hypothetical protein
MDSEKTPEELKFQWEEDDRLEIEQAVKALLATRVGRRYLRRLLEFGALGRNPFTPNALTMSFNCGELNVGQKIQTDIIAVDPEGWVNLQKEANDEYRTREQQLFDARNNRDPESGIRAEDD